MSVFEHFILMFIRHAAIVAYQEHRIDYELAASVNSAVLNRVRVLEAEIRAEFFGA